MAGGDDESGATLAAYTAAIRTRATMGIAYSSRLVRFFGSRERAILHPEEYLGKVQY